MSEPKFIVVDLGYAGRKTIAIDNIMSIEPFGMSGSQITLKEVKNGNNVVLHCMASMDRINSLIASL